MTKVKKSKKNRAKKRVLGFLALALVLVISIGSGIAYLSDYDAATNKFTLGDIDIDLDEPNWKNPVKAVTEINGDTKGRDNLTGDSVVVGDVLTYSVTAFNVDIEAHNIVITDTLETGLTLDVASISHGGTYDAATRTITWTFDSVAALSEVTVFFKATVNENAVEKVVNDAFAKVGDNDAKRTNPVENPLTEEPQDPTKKVAATSESGKNGRPVTVGDIITFEITFYNNSDNAGNVTVTDPLDPQVSFVSASDGGVHNNGTVTWTFNNMPAHSSRTITVTVRVEEVRVNGALDPITNQATTTDPSNTYTTNIVTIPVSDPEKPKKPEKDYAADTTAGMNGAKVNVGDTIKYQINYYNHEDAAANVIITDVIDIGLDVVTASISNGGTYDAATRTITWNIANAPSHAKGFVTFEATVNASAVVKVVNEAMVQIGNNDAVKTNKVVNPTEDPNMPGDSEVKDPTVVGIEGDGYMRIKVEFQDKDGKLLTDAAQIQKIIDTLYYDTSYTYQGSVADPSTLTSNIVAGQSYTSQQLADMVAAGSIFNEYNKVEFAYDTTRADNAAVKYYNYIANNGVLSEGTVATLFTNSVLPSDWDNADFDIIGDGYIVKVTAQICQVENLTQEQAYEALDNQAP